MTIVELPPVPRLILLRTNGEEESVSITGCLPGFTTQPIYRESQYARHTLHNIHLSIFSYYWLGIVSYSSDTGYANECIYYESVTTLHMEMSNLL